MPRIETVKKRMVEKSTPPRELIKLLSSLNGMWIGRIDPKTKKDFVDLANEDFSGDYGMVLKWLMDYLKGTLVTPDSVIMSHVEDLSVRISALEGKTEPVKKNSLYMGDGTKIEVMRDE